MAIDTPEIAETKTLEEVAILQKTMLDGIADLATEVEQARRM